MSESNFIQEGFLFSGDIIIFANGRAMSNPKIILEVPKNAKNDR